MTDNLQTKLRESALAFRSQFAGENEPLAALLEDAAEQIDILREAETRWIGRIYDMRKALGTDASKAMLDDLPEEVARVRAADRRAGMMEAAEIAQTYLNHANMNKTWKKGASDAAAAIRAEAEKGNTP